MGQALLTITGRTYRISCRDGDEDRISRLGDEIAVRADSITASLGSVPEGQLLVMTALMLADELSDTRAGVAPAAATPPMMDITRLTRIVERLETLARP
ncbi:cell division protein ZapA [Sandarakinorhabdus sp.]|uniref:cell division protein ZapA n=1 Tax=Sandarakinorhabdus sp. TaxID=1916663 RepID=UPI00286E952A|nr:cell division protein ZapA [Sandarakinorhabdus sp.]